MHPLIPSHPGPSLNDPVLSMEHPLPHGLRFASAAPGPTNPTAAPSVSNAFSPDPLSAPLHPQFTSITSSSGEGDPGLPGVPSQLIGGLPPPHMMHPPGYPPRPVEDDLKSNGSRRSRRSRNSSCSSYSSNSGSSSGSRSSGSHSRSFSSGSSGGKRKGGKGRRSRQRRGSSGEQRLQGVQMPFSQVQAGIPQDPRMMLVSGGGMAPGPDMTAMGLDGFHTRGRGSFPPGPPLYGYSSPMLGHQPSPIPGSLGHPQFGGMLSSIPRGAMHPGFHASGGARFMVEGSAPHLADESLPTYPNAAAAPNRLPAHKPVRLTQPKHPLAPPGTPVYFKYGEEHYPEETVPPEYTFTETDGTVCRYITNFLVYNKRGERLLPIEVLDQPRHAALVLYGSLLPAAAMSQTNPRSGKKDGDDDGSRSKKRPAGASTGGSSKRHFSGIPSRDSGRKKNEVDRWVAERGGVPGGVNQTYPVRVELLEWCIDYGQEPCNVPFIWLISRWDVYYRLEKPAGRYIPTFATAKMKFEVSTRVIKTLQYRPGTEYRILVDLLTAATRHERYQKRIERKAQLKKERRAQRQEMKRRAGGLKSESDREEEDDLNDPNKSRGYDEAPSLEAIKSEDQFDPKAGDMPSSGVGPTKKKNRNWRIQSLSTPQGTGVVVTDEDGRPQATTPWGAPYAVDGFKESMLLGLAEFLESQLRNFMEGVGGIGDGGCPNLLNTPFMRTLRERTALRMETLQLMEAKRRALEVAKSLAEAASGHPHPSQQLSLDPSGMLSSGAPEVAGMGGPGSEYMGFGQNQPATPNGFAGRPPGNFFPGDHAMPPGAPYYQPNGMNMLPQGMMPGGAQNAIAAADGIQALETEIQHLQHLLKDSEDDSDDEEDDDRGSGGESDGSSSENDDHESSGGRMGSARPRPGNCVMPNDDMHHNSQHHMYHSGGDLGFRLTPGGETADFPMFEATGEVRGPRSLVRPRTGANQANLLEDFELTSSESSRDDFEEIFAAVGEGRSARNGLVSGIRRGESVEEEVDDVVRPLCPGDGTVSVQQVGGSHQVIQGSPLLSSEVPHTSNFPLISAVSDASLSTVPARLISFEEAIEVQQLSAPQTKASETARLEVSPVIPPGGQLNEGPIASGETKLDTNLPPAAAQSSLHTKSHPYLYDARLHGLSHSVLGAPHMISAMGLFAPGIQGFPFPPTFNPLDPQSFAGRPMYPFGPVGHPPSPFLNHFPGHYFSGAPRPPPRRLSDTHFESQIREARAQHEQSLKKQKNAFDHEVPAKRRKLCEKHPTQSAKPSARPSDNLQTGGAVPREKVVPKSPKAKPATPSISISMPPFPRDIADDLDLPPSDLRYYREQLPLDKLEIVQHVQVLEVVDFLSVVSDWLHWPTLRRLDLQSVERSLGFSPEFFADPTLIDCLMAALLRLFCRRSEKLRPTEINDCVAMALNEFEIPEAAKTASDSTACLPMSNDISKPQSPLLVENPISYINDQECLSYNAFDSAISSNPFTSTSNHNWVSSVTSIKQPPQILSSKGWVSATSSYAPIEAVLSQPTLRLLARFNNQLQRSSVKKLTPSPQTSDAPVFLSFGESFFLKDHEQLSSLLQGAVSLVLDLLNSYTRKDITEEFLYSRDIAEQLLFSYEYRSTHMKPPKLNDLGLGMISGIQWWRDDGIIDKVNWELFCRLSLWDSFCDISPDLLRQRRAAVEAPSQKKKKKSKTQSAHVEGLESPRSPDSTEAKIEHEGIATQEALDHLVASSDVISKMDNTDTMSSSNVNESDIVGHESLGDVDTSEPSQCMDNSEAMSRDELKINIENPDDVEGSETMSVRDQTIEDDESVNQETSYWNWSIDNKKAQSCGLQSDHKIQKMEKLLKQLLWVFNEPDIIGNSLQTGWSNGLNASDRLFLINWLVMQIVKSPIGRDIVERNVDIFNTIKSYILSHDKPVVQTKATKSPKGKKLTPIIKDINKVGDERPSAIILNSPDPFPDKNVPNHTIEGGEIASLEKKRDILNDKSNDAEQLIDVTMSQNMKLSENIKPSEDVKVCEDSVNEANVIGQHDSILKEELIASPAQHVSHHKKGKTKCVKREKDQPLNASFDVPVQTNQWLTPDEINQLLESANRRFRVRRDFIGEDRYFNRYYLFQSGRNTSQLLIEFHVVIPISNFSNETRSQIIVECHRLPSGIATLKDVNTESPDQEMPIMVIGNQKRIGSRGRPRKQRVSSQSRKIKMGQVEEIPTKAGEEIATGNDKETEETARVVPETVISVIVPENNEGVDLRRSERTTKGQRKETSYIEEILREKEEKRLLAEEKQTIYQEDLKNTKKKSALYATFLPILKRSFDKGIFLRRPLNGKIGFSVSNELETSTDYIPLSTEYVANRKDKIYIFEGNYKQISKKKKVKSQEISPLTNETNQTGDVSSSPDIYTDLLNENPIETIACVPVIQWGIVQNNNNNLIQQFISSLSNFTTREQNLKWNLMKLAESKAFHQIIDKGTETNGTDKHGTSQPNNFSTFSTDILVIEHQITKKIDSLIEKILNWKLYCFDQVIGCFRNTDIIKFNLYCHKTKTFNQNLKVENPEFLLILSLIKMRLCIYLILLSIRLIRSIPQISKLITPIPGSGWNTRSSYMQWENELKGLDWMLNELCYDQHQNYLENLLSKSLVNSSIISQLSPKQKLISAVPIILDFISLIDLYFSIYIRFGINRYPVDYLFTIPDNVPLPLKNKLQIGRKFRLNCQEYLEGLQKLKNKFHLMFVEDSLPECVDEDHEIEILQIWWHKTNEISKDSQTASTVGQEGLKSKKSKSNLLINSSTEEFLHARLRCCKVVTTSKNEDLKKVVADHNDPKLIADVSSNEDFFIIFSHTFNENHFVFS